jgi:hypothetical protein
MSEHMTAVPLRDQRELEATLTRDIVQLLPYILAPYTEEEEDNGYDSEATQAFPSGDESMEGEVLTEEEEDDANGYDSEATVSQDYPDDSETTLSQDDLHMSASDSEVEGRDDTEYDSEETVVQDMVPEDYRPEMPRPIAALLWSLLQESANSLAILRVPLRIYDDA